MAERKKENFSPPAIGGSSLLVVFAVLALTVFALLSLSTVRADVRLGDTAAQAVKDYYAAEMKAQEVLAQLRDGGRGAVSEYAVLEMYAMYPDGCETTYSYTIPISENRSLEVTVAVSPDGTDYSVQRWESVYTGDWVFDDSLYVWDGE